MSRLPLRARIAPVALVIVFGFVVVGFLRADREMVRAEQDRAALRASESAALVEAFLFRHSNWLRATEPLILNYGDRRQPEEPSLEIGERAQMPGAFDALWVLDSGGVVRAAKTFRASASVPTPGTPAGQLNSPVPKNELLALIRSGTTNPNALVSAGNARDKQLFFVFPLRTPTRSVVVGVLPIDSLTALIRRRRNTASFNFVIKSPTDTIVYQPAG